MAGAAANDTWTFQGLAWTHVVQRTPTAREGGALAYDEADRYVLLFGGFSHSRGVFGDTWKFLHGIWTPLFPAVSPSPRYVAAMTFDQADGRVVLFGGATAHSDLSDTWTYLAGNWTVVPSGGGIVSPPGRGDPSISYDAADGYVLMFGGFNATLAGHLLNDTWSFAGGVWTNLTTAGHPSSRSDSEMTYDSEDGYVLLFSGFEHAAVPRGYEASADTWTFSAGVWTNVTATLSSGPPARAEGGLVDDTYLGYPVLFGGLINFTTGGGSGTWSFVGSGWTHLLPADHPPGGYGFGLAFDPSDNEVVLLGGAGNTWVF